MQDTKHSNIKTVSIDSSYTVKEPSGLIVVDTRKMPVLIYLPALVNVDDQILTIRKHEASTYPVTLIGNKTKIGPDHIWVMGASKELKLKFTGDNWVPQS